jgi:hypothetical protein
MLFSKGIVRVQPDTFKLTLIAESPVPINAAGDCLHGRLYFASGSHVYSYQLPTASGPAREK